MASQKPTCYPIELSAPVLPQANKHGIGMRAATRLMVTVRPYATMEEGDLIELFWGGCYVGSRQLTATDLGKAVALRVPESFMHSGRISVWYQVQKIGSEPSLSPVKDVSIKLDCPGGQLIDTCNEENQGLAPLAVPDKVLRNGLTARQLRRGVDLTIEAYQNMAAKDEITLRWGDLRMDLPAIDPEDVGKPITLKVPPTLIREAGEDEQLEVTYCVIDRVGNNSRWAPPRSFKVSGVNR
ncbi:MAG: hypothetical protein ACOH2R_26130 [Pseudomonas sp.]